MMSLAEREITAAPASIISGVISISESEEEHMVSEVFAGISAFNAMLSAAKTLKDMNDAAARLEITLELRQQILAAQEEYATLTEKVRALEAKLAEFETWETEKQRYELKAHERGIMAYALKPDAQPPEPPHSICPDCYQKREKRILQAQRVGAGAVLECQTCGWHAYTQGLAPAPGFRGRR